MQETLEAAVGGTLRAGAFGEPHPQNEQIEKTQSARMPTFDQGTLIRLGTGAIHSLCVRVYDKKP